MIASVVKPADPGYHYDEPENATLIEATKWRVSQNEFNISFSLEKVIGDYGNGVYTIVMWDLDENRTSIPIANISVFRT